MPSSKDKLRSTFPIPNSRLRARKWKLALGAPITWASYLPVVGAYAFLDVPVAIFGGLAALVTGGVAWYWKTHHGKLETKLLEELIAESNESQDQHLFDISRKMQNEGFNDYATSLASFIERKQEIESALHTNNGPISQEKREIENLVDSIVFGVSDQIQKLVELDQRLKNPAFPLSEAATEKITKARDKISERVHEAWKLLDETWGRLGDLIDPAHSVAEEDASHSELELSLEKLRQEHQIASRVIERMSDESSDPFEIDLPQETEM